MKAPKTALAVFLTVACLAGGLFFACSQNTPETSAPAQSIAAPLAKAAAAPDLPPGLVKLQNAMNVQNLHTKGLMARQGVVGTATGLDDDGVPVIIVYLKDASAKVLVPSELDGIPVTSEVTGEFRAMRLKVSASGKAGARPPAPAVSHTAIQTPPIRLGTSGGWSEDLANGYCCGGTLGALVTDGAKQYILSNYHVFQSDIVMGGNNDTAAIGDAIVQPGLIDASCGGAALQTVAYLSGRSFPASLPASNVDASIAEVAPGMVSATGDILEIGTLSASTINAFIGQKVKKSGRTSGLTRSAVSGLNASVSVAYDNECAGGAAFTKVYSGQIIIKNKGSAFLKGGDSGSLMVEDVGVNPRAVGLLFAGSNVSAVANPIGQVLAHFGVTMVGN